MQNVGNAPEVSAHCNERRVALVIKLREKYPGKAWKHGITLPYCSWAEGGRRGSTRSGSGGWRGQLEAGGQAGERGWQELRRLSWQAWTSEEGPVGIAVGGVDKDLAAMGKNSKSRMAKLFLGLSCLKQHWLGVAETVASSGVSAGP